MNQFDSTRVDVQFLKEEVRKGKVRVIDVRSETEFGICKIDGSESTSQVIFFLPFLTKLTRYSIIRW